MSGFALDLAFSAILSCLFVEFGSQRARIKYMEFPMTARETAGKLFGWVLLRQKCATSWIKSPSDAGSSMKTKEILRPQFGI
jgi:hypothetical protein